MSDRTTGERSPGAPSQRALGAMESAVRRARERAGVVTTPGSIQEDTQPVSIAFSRDDPPTPPRPPSSPAPPWGAPRAALPGGRDESARREHWLTISVAVVAGLVVVAGIALGVSAGGGGQQGAAPPAAAPRTVAHAGTTPAAVQPAQRPGTKGHSGDAARSNTTTSTAPPATSGGPPVIASLSPASGAAGQGIQVEGSNFLSSNGQILATFNGQVAPTSCPAANACTVTVPPMTGSSSAQVIITTATGASNAVTFTYS